MGLSSTRIKRLFKILRSYSFNLYYLKEKKWHLVMLYLERNMMISIYMKSYLFHSTCKVYYRLDITI